MRQTAIDVIKQYNAMAMAAPNYVWSRRFAHPRMENAPGSGRIQFEYQCAVKGSVLGHTEAYHIIITTMQAYDELGRLKRRMRRARRKQQKEQRNEV